MKKSLITELNNASYDYDLMVRDIEELKKRYTFLQMSSIGKSVLGRPIYLLSIGFGKRRVHINGSHHGNEWLTSYVIMKCIQKLCEEVEEAKILLSNMCYDFVPMVNPDGVMLCTKGIECIPSDSLAQTLIKMNEGANDFSRWKANIRGVDLNRNYDAGFMDYKKSSQYKWPSYAYYAGDYPECEPESRALAELTRKRKYQMVLAFHTQGEVIYWNYGGVQVPMSKEYAIMFSKVSHYELDEPEPQAAAGGYKDWFIKMFHLPGFTIECGRGENPLPISQARTIIEATYPIIKCTQKSIKEGATKFGSL